MTKIRLGVVAAIGLAAMLIQFVPVSRQDPPVVADIPAPAAVKAILKRACYDCHSHETRWPWYTRIAPLSWMIADDVRVGRTVLNFSTWNQYRPDEQAEKRELSWEEVEVYDMPPLYYLALHPDSVLSDHERDLLRDWTSRSAAKDAAQHLPPNPSPDQTTKEKE
jgi:hypothetical protein